MKKALCILICLLLICQAFTFCAAADVILMVTKPSVYISGDNEYNVVWVTDVASAAFVELTVDGVTYVYRDEMGGVLRTDDWIHTVRVPKSVLDAAKSYTVVTRTAATNDKSGITYDSELRHSSEFVPYSGAESVRFGFFSDLHLKPAEFTRVDQAKQILTNSIGGVDVIVLNGDITDAMPTENYFSETLLEAAYRLSEGKTPVVYVRGNHEARGGYAQYLKRYLAFDTGNMYGTFSYGPVSAIVADCGEDKADYRDEYGGMVDFDNYNATQLTWLESMGGYRKGALYNLAISHSPRVIDRMQDASLAAMLAHKTDVLVGGHFHSAQEYDYASFPIVTDGGLTQNGYRAGYMEFNGSNITFNVFSEDGTNVFSYATTAAPKEAATETAPTPEATVGELPPLTEAGSGGMSGADINGASVSASVTVGPTVFDAGEYYNIVYSTDAGTEMTKAAAEVIKGDVCYTFTDSQAGNVVSNLVHSIEVPKKILNGATYRIKTTYIGEYGAYGEKIAYDGLITDLGYTVTSGDYSFPDLSDTDKLCIASFSDIAGAKTDAASIKNSLTVDPDIIILGGNMTDGINSRREFANTILKFTSAVSGGVTPVILSRGDGECYGEYAPYLYEILRVTKNGERDGMYFTTSYGDVNFIVCDSAAGYLSYDYMARQSAWLSTLTLGGKHTFAVGADAEYIKTALGGSYDALGCVDILGKGGERGKIAVYEKGKFGQTNNTVSGTGDIKTSKIKATIDKDRNTPVEAPAVGYKSNEQKQKAIDADTENEPVVEKVEDITWHEAIVREWNSRGYDRTRKYDLSPMNCAKFLVTYCNLTGVNFDALKGNNLQSKAISFASENKIISFSPPIMYEFNVQELEAILSK